MRISKVINQLSDSMTLGLTAKVNELRRAGHSIYSFTAGQLDFPTPKAICDAGKAAIDDGFTRYTAATGISQLKDAIINWTKERIGLEFKRSNVLVSSGAKHATYNILRTILNPGDRVIIPVPYWVSYPEMVLSCGALPLFIETYPEDGYILSGEALRAALSPPARAIILNSPQNPTGAVYRKDDLEEIADILSETDITVISDEIYSEIVMDGKQSVSIASILPEQTVIINGVSKAYAMTGWRIGWAMGDSELIAAAGRLQAHSTSNPCSISQMAALKALSLGNRFPALVRDALRRRRELATKILDGIEGIRYFRPEGAFYIFVDVGDVAGTRFESTLEFADWLLDNYAVAVIPGEAFGTPWYIRISIATSDEEIERGLTTFAAAMESLR